MRLAMIPSAYRTVFFLGVARRLEAEGHEVFWLSPNGRWARWLRREGVAEEKVFELTCHAPEWTGGAGLPEPDQTTLSRLEDRGALTARNIVLMDPLLRLRDTGGALRYLAVAARRVEEYLAAHRISLVVGEQTWAFELTVGQVCRGLGIRHLAPHTIRIPDGRFAFFDGHTETELVAIREPGEEERERAREILAEFRARRPQPSYMAVNRSVVRFDPGRLALLARHLVDLARDPFDETSRRPAGLVLDQSKQVLRKWRNRWLGPFDRPALPPRRPFVFFPLHMQPEASVDIKGSPYSNQLEMVRAMVRTLPLSHELWVKEHGIALTRRTRAFYRELAAIPGVRIVHPDAPSFEIMRHAALTVTITGTAAYEAALLGLPAATIAPIFFEQAVRFPRFDPLATSLADLLHRSEPRPEETEPQEEFLAWLLARSVPGTFGDALWMPASMEPENLETVAAGFRELFESPHFAGAAGTSGASA